MTKFQGIYTALLTPFDKQDKINEKVLLELIEYNIGMGVHGFYACGSTAEAFLLSHEERRHLMKLVKEMSGNRVGLIAHVGAISTKEAVSLAEYAAELGYDAVSAVAPFYFKFSFDEICDYYNRIASATDLKMLVYNIPAFTGVSMGLEQLGKLLHSDRFLGVKHTSNDFFALEGIKTHFPDKVVFNGYDEMLLSGLAAGADGGIGSTYNVMGDKYVRLYDLFREGKWNEAQKIQKEVNEVIRLLVDVGVMPGEKAILDLLGMDFGPCREPFRKCTKEQYKLLEEKALPIILKDR